MRYVMMTLLLCLAVSAGLAHQGVRNDVVLQRMELMSALQAQIEVLGKMARGKIPYDEAAATAARTRLIDLSQRVPDRFAPPEMDPLSEARENIWTDWPGFAARNTDAVLAARALDVADLPQGLAAVGRACSACHAAYRISKP